MRSWILTALFLLLTEAVLAFAQTPDAIEPADLAAARAFGWEPTDHTDLTVTTEAKVGRAALRVVPAANAEWRTLYLFRMVDLAAATAADTISFWVKQNFGSGMRVQLWGDKGFINRSFPVKSGEWTRVDLDLDLKHWEHTGDGFGHIARLSFYERAFQSPDQYMILDGLTITAGGKFVLAEDPVHNLQAWAFPHQTSGAWYLGNAQVAWAISKTTGQVAGGWNAQTKERYLNFLEGRYHLEDRKSLVTGRETADKIVQAKYDEKAQRLELICANPVVPDLTIRKRYWLSGNKLFQRIAFATHSGRGVDAADGDPARHLQFLTYNSQAAFTPGYRNGGYYMGGADGGGPLVPAPQIGEWRKVTQYQNTAKGMLLHQPQAGYSFAHIRTKLDDQFVWPYFTGAIASYVEAPNMLSYTPDGWDMSLGTSRLSAKETSFEQYLSIFPGDWQTFIRKEYPALPEVQQALKQIPPVPDWVGDIKVECGADMDRLRDIVKMTDEGVIMVLFNLSGSWADYYVEDGMEGGYGGWITGPELRDHIRRIKALSPRIKVGIYQWTLSTYPTTRIYRKHPEWFRYANKDGEPLSTFPGMAPNYAQLLSIPAYYQEVLSQFDRVLNYLGTDFIYLDDPKAINLIDWKSGEFTRDDLSFRFFLDLKRLAAKHGPDKMIFFNNRGNPYGDVNFIEARDQLRANYWRNFVGIGAVIQEFVSATRPQARTNLLYFTEPLRREYMNRILALGWIPSWEYCDLAATRPFFQAAYEVGNCAPVPARYSPDWKGDKGTNLESYAVQRHGDSGTLLSFINHAEARETVPVHLDLDSLNLDRNGHVFVWEYTVEDAMEFEGQVTENLARETYARTGWQLDRMARRRLVFAGPYQKSLDLKLHMEPLILHQLYVTSQPAAVYSEDHLPSNYLFAQMPKVSLQAKADWRKGRLDVAVSSSRDEVEIMALLPLSSYRVQSVLLDGKAVDPRYACESDDVFPVIEVTKGKHTLSLAFTPAGQDAAPAGILTATASDTGITATLPGHDGAVFTIEKDGRSMFSRLLTGQTGAFTILLPPARDAGTYTVSVRAVADDKGQLHPVTGVQASVELTAAKPDLHLSPPVTWVPARCEITPVNRTINGLEVLNSAIATTATWPNEIQPGLNLLTATAQPDVLTLEAGTTRAILQGQDNLLGAAFAGLEVRNLRRAQVKLSNTFYNAFHLRGPGWHVPERPNSRNFAGIVIDYHTPAGYTKRVALATGVLNRECSSKAPEYGKGTIADEYRDLGSALIEMPEKTFALDLQSYAPVDWDGQVWLSVGADWVCANRRLTLTILAANDAVTGDILTGIDPKAFREAYNKPQVLQAPRSPGGIVIDGLPYEEWWREAAHTDEFYLMAGVGVSKAQTEAQVMYDDVNLYVAMTCHEPDRRKPLIVGGPPWNDDEVEVWMDPDGDGRTFRQVIVNAAGTKVEYGEAGPTHIGATTATHLVEGDRWLVEMAIPFAGLGVPPPKPGDQWRFSLCRIRPPGQGFNEELIVWAPLQSGGFNDFANFGTLIFR